VNPVTQNETPKEKKKKKTLTKWGKRTARCGRAEVFAEQRDWFESA
jgi:hypothetical protein